MSRTGPPPNYYRILEVSETASRDQIRTAYKKSALKYHPDRLPADSDKRSDYTRKFQLVNDAYYTLSDDKRRREYDAQRKIFGFGGGRGAGTSAGGANAGEKDNGDGAEYTSPFEEFDEAAAGEGSEGGATAGEFFSWAWNFFMNNYNSQQRQQARQETEDEQFGNVFEEMMGDAGIQEQEEGARKGKIWSLAGGAAGGVLGFIAANFPGAVAGMVAGNRLGAIRDARGKSVYAVFQDMPQDDRRQLLTQLAMRILGQVAGAGSGF